MQKLIDCNGLTISPSSTVSFNSYMETKMNIEKMRDYLEDHAASFNAKKEPHIFVLPAGKQFYLTFAIQNGQVYIGVYNSQFNVLCQHCDISQIRPQKEDDLNRLKVTCNNDLFIMKNNLYHFPLPETLINQWKIIIAEKDLQQAHNNDGLDIPGNR